MAGLTFAVSTGDEFHVPGWVTDHPAFLRWMASADIPEELRIGFLNGAVWVEPMAERAYTHNRIKTAVSGAVDAVVRAGRLGVYFCDGMQLTTDPGDGGFTTYPDGTFVSREGIAAGRVRLAGAKEGEEDTRLVGSPDLVVEVVSDGSVDKDTAWLMSGYWNAGVAEYWLIDARKGPIRFTVYRRGQKGFTPVRKAGGWVRSPVLGKEFRFAPAEETFGRPDHVLEAR